MTFSIVPGDLDGADIPVVGPARRPAHASGELLRVAAHRGGDADPVLRGRFQR